MEKGEGTPPPLGRVPPDNGVVEYGLGEKEELKVKPVEGRGAV